MKSIRRKSKQREIIFEIISNTASHPTVNNVYKDLKKIIPYVSLGNVYRNIKILIEEGRIQLRDFGDGYEHYDAIANNHYHFICEKCGTISDFDFSVQDHVMEEAQKNTKNIIIGHTINFFGICEKCKRNNRN
jgi:Fur family transcriptional regulator, peroxide stress response regulator